MINESIFTFLSKDEIFIDVYEKALEAEKTFLMKNLILHLII